MKGGEDDLFRALAWDRAGFYGMNGHDGILTDIEGISKRPIMVTTTDGHSALVNQRALDLAGITNQTPNPLSGMLPEQH